MVTVYRFSPEETPSIARGVVRFAMPSPTCSKYNFDPHNPGTIRGTHESLRLQTLVYLREHWDGVNGLQGTDAEIDIQILRDYCPEVVFLVCQEGLRSRRTRKEDPVKYVHVDFNSGIPDVAKLIAEMITFKYRGRQLTFVGSNL